MKRFVRLIVSLGNSWMSADHPTNLNDEGSAKCLDIAKMATDEPEIAGVKLVAFFGSEAIVWRWTR